MRDSDRTTVEDLEGNVASDDGGLTRNDTDPKVAPVIASIIKLAWKRRALLQAELRLNNQIGAIERGLAEAGGSLESYQGMPRRKGSKGRQADDNQSSGALAALLLPEMFIARDILIEGRKDPEKTLAKLAKQLPVYPWVEQTRGFGALGFALIVGEAGDLSLYPNPGKLWKRMGLGGTPEGEIDKRKAGVKNGYSPRRRSLMFNIGEALLRQNRGEYKTLYDGRKAYEILRDPEIKLIVAHLRAKRYMEKRLLKNLWQAWRRNPDV